VDVPQNEAAECDATKERNHLILQWDAKDGKLVDQPIAEWALHPIYSIYMFCLRLEGVGHPAALEG
jgi:hypothetical protein